LGGVAVYPMLNKNRATPRKGKDRRPGKKSALPPRNPIASKLPNLKGKEGRSAKTLALAELNELEVQAEILKEIDFTDDNVLDALEHGRKKAHNAGEEADLFDEIIQEKAINDEIAWAVRVYISAMAFAINPNDFRSAIKAFGSALEKFTREIATKGHLIEIAIKHELRLQGMPRNLQFASI